MGIFRFARGTYALRLAPHSFKGYSAFRSAHNENILNNIYHLSLNVFRPFTNSNKNKKVLWLSRISFVRFYVLNPHCKPKVVISKNVQVFTFAQFTEFSSNILPERKIKFISIDFNSLILFMKIITYNITLPLVKLKLSGCSYLSLSVKLQPFKYLKMY